MLLISFLSFTDVASSSLAEQDQTPTKPRSKIANMMKIQASFLKGNARPKETRSLANLFTKSPRSSQKSNSALVKINEASITNETTKACKSCRYTKVYLSEKQSKSIMGIPAVPPSTPGQGR